MLVSKAGDRLDVQKAIDAKLIPLCLRYVKGEAPGKILREATWISLVIAHSTNEAHIGLIMESGAIPVLISLISSTDPLIQEHVLPAIYFIVSSHAWQPLLHKPTTPRSTP